MMNIQNCGISKILLYFPPSPDSAPKLTNPDVLVREYPKKYTITKTKIKTIIK